MWRYCSCLPNISLLLLVTGLFPFLKYFQLRLSGQPFISFCCSHLPPLSCLEALAPRPFPFIQHYRCNMHLEDIYDSWPSRTKTASLRIRRVSSLHLYAHCWQYSLDLVIIDNYNHSNFSYKHPISKPSHKFHSFQSAQFPSFFNSSTLQGTTTHFSTTFSSALYAPYTLISLFNKFECQRNIGLIKPCNIQNCLLSTS